MFCPHTDTTKINSLPPIKSWLRTRSTIEFLGTWEALYNPSFKVVEFDHFRKEADFEAGKWKLVRAYMSSC